MVSYSETVSAPHLLLLDDRETDLYPIQTAFALYPEVRLTLFQHAGEALAWLHQGLASDVMPDLLLLDIHLTDVDGFEWLMALRQDKRFDDLPVLIYSQTLMTRDLIRLEEFSLCSWWPKPTSLRGMYTQIQRLVSLWERESAFDCDRLQRLGQQPL